MDRNSDPRYIGPGSWAILHMAAKRADAISDFKPFLWLVDTYRQGFPCGDCRKHFDEFCTINPVTVTGRSDAAFHWTWRAHNNANILTKKPVLDYEVVNKWWTRGGCATGCVVHTQQDPKPEHGSGTVSGAGSKQLSDLPYRIVSRDHKS